MKIKGLLTLLLLICLLNTACDNKLNVNAEFEEVMYVYGLLEINEPTQYIRIQKNYLDPKTSALTLAKDPSQTYYPTEDLIVEMGPTGSENYTLLVPDTLAKEEGVFSSENNIIYKYDSPLEADKEYEIRITNTVTGEVTSATTEVVQDFQLQIPPEGSSPYSLGFASKDQLGNEKELELLFTQPAGAKVFDIIFRFYYFEHKLDGTTTSLFADVTLEKYYTVADVNNSNAISIKYIGQDVLRSFANKLIASPEITRELAPLPGEFIIYCGEQTLWDYYRVNVLSQTGITTIEVQPDFTNVNNGLGIFSSRMIKRRPNLRFNAETVQYIACDDAFKSLNFEFSEILSCN